MKITSLLLLCLLLVPALALGVYAAEKKTKKVLTYDDLLPQPDTLPSSLTPQQPLRDDTPLVAEVRTHSVNNKIQGIDVSHYQGNINWRKVAGSGEVSYVYIKATEGEKLVDATLRQNLIGARQAGLYVGVYHFFRPNVNVQSQFLNFTRNVHPNDMDLIPIVDIEHRGRESLAAFRSKLKQFLDKVERYYGVRPILYTSRDFYNKYLSGPFTNYKYMIARYHPEVPELCDDAAFVMWQYSATSRLPGISHNVDRSCFMDNYTLSDILLPNKSSKR
jgi:lysozyme